jgi:hypothetical protein
MGGFLSDTFFKSFSKKYCKEFKMYRKGKDIRGIKILSFNLCVVTNLSAPSLLFFSVPSVFFWEKFPTAEF